MGDRRSLSTRDGSDLSSCARALYPALALCLGALALGCGLEEPVEFNGDMVRPLGASCGSRTTMAKKGVPHILYLNLGGGTFHVDASYADNSATGASSFATGTLSPLSIQDPVWTEKLAVEVRRLFAPYDLIVTTTRPASGDYNMLMLGGQPSQLGYTGGNVGGLGTLDCGDTSDRNIGFAFDAGLKADDPFSAGDYASVVAHEAGHNYGLVHSDVACDIMSYGACFDPVTYVDNKTFLDQNMPLQADSKTGAWSCGMSTTNSHQLLLAALGPAKAPPKVTISSPAPGAKVSSPFKLSATVDTSGVMLELLVDGVVTATRHAPPFEFDLTLAAGAHTLTVNALDAQQHKGTTSLSVTVELPPSPGGVGDACQANADCQSQSCVAGVCAAVSSKGDESSSPTTPSTPAPTTPGASQADTSSTSTTPTSEVLWTGGCALGAGPGPRGSAWLLLALVLVLAGRFRRR